MSHPADPIEPTLVTFETTDINEAHSYLSGLFGSSFAMSTPAPDYVCRLERHGTNGFALDRITQASSIDFRVEPVDYLRLMRVDRGSLERTQGRDVGKYTAGDLLLNSNPLRPHEVQWHDAEIVAAQVDLSLIAEAAGCLPEDSPSLVFSSLDPLEGDGVTHCQRLLSYLYDDLLPNSAAAANPLVVGAAGRLLAATIVTAFPGPMLDQAEALVRRDATPVTVQRAIDFMERNAHTDIGPADVARAVRVTPRAVQQAFKKHQDTTPSAYLRRIRLERAHRDLRAADPSRGDTVTTIAARWGFASPSRFTAYYREVFGRLPSHTLRE